MHDEEGNGAYAVPKNVRKVTTILVPFTCPCYLNCLEWSSNLATYDSKTQDPCHVLCQFFHINVMSPTYKSPFPKSK